MWEGVRTKSNHISVMQHTFNTQFTQRYRNCRRSSTKVTKPRVILPQTTFAAAPEIATDDIEEYEENVETLSKLVKGKTPPAAHSVKQLMDITRKARVQWMKEEIMSIKNILDKYPCFRISKWVS